jgi:hypothetical protein
VGQPIISDVELTDTGINFQHKTPIWFQAGAHPMLGPPPKSKEDYVGTISVALCDLPFSQNQPLKLADD